MTYFVEKTIPRLWFSQRIAQPQFSEPKRGIFFLFVLIAFCSLTLPNTSFAQIKQIGDRQVQDQNSQPNPFMSPPPAVFVPEESFWDLIGKNLHGGYGVSIMGPRLNGNSDETYNIYVQDVAPIQLFHGVNLRYQVSPDLEMGIGETAVQNLYDGVVGNTGTIYNHSFLLYDPMVFATLPNLIKFPWMNVTTAIGISLSVTQASQDIGKITSIEVGQNWAISTIQSPWSFGIMTDIKPSFYVEPSPTTLSRQTFLFTIGHYLGYQIAPEFAIQTSTNFDWEHRDPDPQGSFHFGTDLPDTFRFSFSITPHVPGLFVSLGGYFQFLIWNPDAGTSIIGADFTVSF